MSRAFTFPGQGSQAVGMGQDLAEALVTAREVFEEIDDALNQSLTKIMFEGPEEDLILTENAQPALMAVSMAVIRVLEHDGNLVLSDEAAFVAGHSLGEYSALAAVGSLSLADTARLLKKRGQAMQQAVPVGEGGMAAILGLSLEEAEAVAVEAGQGEVCAAANDNAIGQVVLSGARGAIERAVNIAKANGAKRAMLLAVSAPFHCALMAPAADVMAQALDRVEFKVPSLPIVTNITAAAEDDPERLRGLLVEQITGRVRWRESVEHLIGEGVEELVELGTGRVLTGLAKRISRELTATSIQTPDDIEAFLK